MKLLVILGIVVLSTTLAHVTSSNSAPLSIAADSQVLTTPLFHTSPVSPSSPAKHLAVIAQTSKRKSPHDGASDQAITTTKALANPAMVLTVPNPPQDETATSRTKRGSSDLWSKAVKQDSVQQHPPPESQLQLNDGDAELSYNGENAEVLTGRSGSPASVGDLYNLPDDLFTSAALRLAAAAAVADKRGGKGLNGFVGMRGKKGDGSYEGGDGIKRSRLKDGFLGMRGKKNPASSAFYGMRGKKDGTEEQQEDDNFMDVDDKRAAPNAFYGMRGKKRVTSLDDVDEEDWRQNFVDEMAAIKRKPANSFLGMRGKKNKEEQDGSSSKRQIPNGFLGMRGKKSSTVEEEGEDGNDAVKRGGSKGFIGMRGKKARLSAADNKSMKYGISSSYGRGREVAGSVGDGHHAPHIRDVRELYRNFMESAVSGDRPRTYADRKRQIGNIFIGMRG